MWGGLPKVVQEVFPNAEIVIDSFHVMKAVSEELNKIRKQVFERNSKFIPLKNGKYLTEEETLKLKQILHRSKRSRKAYQWKEELRGIYEKRLTVEEGKCQIKQWLNQGRSIYCEVITTIHSHLDGICNYFRNRKRMV